MLQSRGKGPAGETLSAALDPHEHNPMGPLMGVLVSV